MMRKLSWLAATMLVVVSAPASFAQTNGGSDTPPVEAVEAECPAGSALADLTEDDLAALMTAENVEVIMGANCPVPELDPAAIAMQEKVLEAISKNPSIAAQLAELGVGTAISGVSIEGDAVTIYVGESNNIEPASSGANADPHAAGQDGGGTADPDSEPEEPVSP